MKRHYSVRQSRQHPKKWKIVIAGKSSWFSSSYDDIDTTLFDTWTAALEAAERLNRLVPVDD